MNPALSRSNPQYWKIQFKEVIFLDRWVKYNNFKLILSRAFCLDNVATGHFKLHVGLTRSFLGQLCSRFMKGNRENYGHGRGLHWKPLEGERPCRAKVGRQPRSRVSLSRCPNGGTERTCHEGQEETVSALSVTFGNGAKGVKAGKLPSGWTACGH